MSDQLNLNQKQLLKQSGQLYQSLETILIPNSRSQHSQIKNFFKQQALNFQKLNYENDEVFIKLQNQQKIYNSYLIEVRQRENHDKNMLKGGKGLLQKTLDGIKQKATYLESITSGMKESVVNLKTKRIASLSCKQEKILHKVFMTLFVVIYKQKQDNFDEQNFKEKALLHEKGEDFIISMASFNFKQLESTHYDLLLMLREDQQFKEISQNPKYAQDLVHIANWVDYVCEGKKKSDEKKEAEKQYQKIRKNISARNDGTLELKKEFCATTLKEIEQYQHNMDNLHGEITTIIAEINQTFELCGNFEKREQKIQQLNQFNQQ